MSRVPVTCLAHIFPFHVFLLFLGLGCIERQVVNLILVPGSIADCLAIGSPHYIHAGIEYEMSVRARMRPGTCTKGWTTPTLPCQLGR
jgi:hypothetical protein